MSLLDIAQQAIAAGFGEDEILRFLSNRVPDLGEGIERARKSGFTPAMIMRFLSSNLPKKNQAGAEKQKNINDEYLSNIGLKTRQEKSEQRNKALKTTLGVAAGALGTYALSRGLPAIANSRIAQNLLAKVGLGSQQENKEASSQLPSDINGEPQNTTGAQAKNQQTTALPQSANQNLTQKPPIQNKAFPYPEFQPTTPIPQTNPLSEKKKSGAIIQDLGIEEIIKNVSKSNKNLEEQAKDVIKSLPPGVKAKYERLSRSGDIKPMIGLLRDYMGHRDEDEKIVYHGSPIHGLTELKRYSRDNADSGGIFFSENSDEAKRYAGMNGKVYKTKINVSDFFTPDQNNLNRLQKTLSIEEIDDIKSGLTDRGIDWAHVSQYEDQLKEAGFKGAMVSEPNAESSWVSFKDSLPLSEEKLLSNNPQEMGKNPVKGDIVAAPNGMTGELKSVRNGQALIEDEGKLHKINLKDLQKPNEHVATTVARLLEIPEIDKSSVLNYWAYDPEDNELFIMYHNGETYKYKEADPELIAELEEAAAIPKTTGENVFGAWSPDDKLSRGATAIQKIISSPKYKKSKKGEPANTLYRKLRKGYDYWSPLRK